MFNYYDEIKEKLLKNEIYAKVKDYSKERNKVLTYYEVGKFLSEAGKEYGNFMKYLIVKNCTHWVQFCYRVIIENFYH